MVCRSTNVSSHSVIPRDTPRVSATSICILENSEGAYADMIIFGFSRTPIPGAVPKLIFIATPLGIAPVTVFGEVDIRFHPHIRYGYPQNSLIHGRNMHSGKTSLCRFLAGKTFIGFSHYII